MALGVQLVDAGLIRAAPALLCQRYTFVHGREPKGGDIAEIVVGPGETVRLSFDGDGQWSAIRPQPSLGPKPTWIDVVVVEGHPQRVGDGWALRKGDCLRLNAPLLLRVGRGVVAAQRLAYIGTTRLRYLEDFLVGEGSAYITCESDEGMIALRRPE